MSEHSTNNSDFNLSWRKLLLIAAVTTILSLMIGVMLQTIFYEICNNIPSIVQQDVHVTLPICKVFSDLDGCDPWVGVMTSLEIWQLSQNVGQIGALLVNMMLIFFFSIKITIWGNIDDLLPGLYLGVLGFIFSFSLALIINLPMNFSSVSSLVKILMILALPLVGYLGARISRKMNSKQTSLGSIHFFPVDGVGKKEDVVESLSERELEVLVLVAEGFTNHEIAKKLYISNATVKTHLQHIFGKLGVPNRTSAVTQALSYGYLRQETMTCDDNNTTTGNQ